MARLNRIQREQAIDMLQANMTVPQVAGILRCTKSTIYALIRCYQATGNTADTHCTGCPRVTTPAEDQYIRVTMLRNRFQTATVMAAILPDRNISSDTQEKTA